MALRMKICSRYDLRYDDRELETAFAAALERQRMRWLVAMGFVGSAIAVVRFFAAFKQERGRAEDAMLLSFLDPRMVWMLPRILAIAVGILVLCTALLKLRCGVLRCINAEVLSIVFFSSVFLGLLVGRLANIAFVGGLDLDWKQEWVDAGRNDDLALTGVQTVFCTTFVMRTHYLTPLMVWSVVTWLLAAVLLGIAHISDAGAAQRVAVVAGVAAFLIWSAHRHERLARGEFLQRYTIREQRSQLVATSALANGMQAIAAHLCDLVLQLDGELRICERSPAADNFFGRSMLSVSFSETVGESDLQRLRSALDLASSSKIPQCLPITLRSARGRVEAHLLITDTGATPQKFVVGISNQNDEAVGESYEMTHFALPPLCDERDADSCTQDRGSEEGTVDSGRIFDARSFEEILRLGRREHWWIEESSLQVPLPVRILGSGGFGVVVRALLHGQAVAAKTFLDATEGNEAKNFEAFLAELRAIRHVRHPHVVSFFGATADADRRSITLVYELISGAPLNVYVTARPRDAMHRFQLVHQMCAALCYLHAQRPRIVHGDLTAGNILVTEEARGPWAKLIDFGLSRVLSSRPYAIGGSMGWAAPELYDRGARATTKGDVFGFGWLTFLAIAGQLPFEGRTDDALVEAVSLMLLHRGVPALAAPAATPFRPECEALCTACLRFDVAERPDMQTVWERVRQWVDAPSVCRLGEIVTSSVLLRTIGWQSVVSDLFVRQVGQNEEMQVDITVSEGVKVKRAFGHLGNAAGPWAFGSRLEDSFEDADGLRLILAATLADLKRGTLAAPVVQRYTGLRLLARPNGTAGIDGGPRRVSARVLFPNASGVASMRLALCGAPPAPSGAGASRKAAL